MRNIHKKSIISLALLFVCTFVHAGADICVNFDGTDAATTATDCSVNAYEFTFNGNAQLDTDNPKFGTAGLLLDGSGDDVRTTTNYTQQMTTNWTISVWLDSDTSSGDHAWLTHFESASPLTAWYFRTEGTKVINFVGWSAGAAPININTATNTLAPSAYHHVVLAKVGTDWGIYYDGVQKAYASDSDTVSITGTLRIGGRNGDQYFDGHIDDPFIISTNYFTAAPNSGKTDTITVPTVAYSEAVAGSRRSSILSRMIKDGDGYRKVVTYQNFTAKRYKNENSGHYIVSNS